MNELEKLADQLEPQQFEKLKSLWARIPEDSKDINSPSREIMHLIGDKWTSIIMMILSAGTMRHAVLRRTVTAFADNESISQFILTQKLRTLERDGLVNRSESEDIPPKVAYSLTPLGNDLILHAITFYTWIYEHGEIVKQARKKYDELNQ
jgi:DNA-binding HxlR family transcriptional regulator